MCLSQLYRFFNIIFFSLLLSTLVSAETAFSVPSNLATKSLLLDGDQTKNLMVVVGERGHILYSENKGKSWIQAKVPTRVMLTGVHVFDDKRAWVVGHDAVILRTQDGGRNWQQVYSAPEDESPLLDVWFKNATHGFAVGAYGLFLVTQDGGGTWEQRWLNEEDDFHLNHLVPGKQGELFIAAEAGNVYRSLDMGESWQTLDSPYHGSYFGILPLSNQRLFLFGLRGHLFYSKDNGESWEEVDSDTTAMLTSGFESPQGHCYIAGLSGVVLVSLTCHPKDIKVRRLQKRHGISGMLMSDQRLLLLGEAGITEFKP